MRTNLAVFTLMALYLSGPATGAAQSRRDGRNDDTVSSRVCFYQERQYRGWEQCFTNGRSDVINLGPRQQVISSIRIEGPAVVIISDGGGFGGHLLEFRNDVPDLRRIISSTNAWRGRIDSVRVRWDGSPGRDDRDNRRTDNRDDRRWDDRDDRRGRGPVWSGICMYEHAGYAGKVECLDAGDRLVDISRQLRGWNDKVSSIRVFGRADAVIFQDTGFGGRRMTINRDVPDLNRIDMDSLRTWNDQLSSVHVGN